MRSSLLTNLDKPPKFDKPFARKLAIAFHKKQPCNPEAEG